MAEGGEQYMSERIVNQDPPIVDDIVSTIRGGAFNPRREAIIQRMVHQMREEPFGNSTEHVMDEVEKIAAQKNGVDMMNI